MPGPRASAPQDKRGKTDGNTVPASRSQRSSEIMRAARGDVCRQAYGGPGDCSHAGPHGDRPQAVRRRAAPRRRLDRSRAGAAVARAATGDSGRPVERGVLSRSRLGGPGFRRSLEGCGTESQAAGGAGLSAAGGDGGVRGKRMRRVRRGPREYSRPVPPGFPRRGASSHSRKPGRGAHR